MLNKWIISIVIIASILGISIQSEAANILCGHGTAPCANSPVEGPVLFNSQTTGAATTAVTVTLTAVTGSRSHIYSIDARCNTAANTSDITITDGGTTIWTSGPLAVTAAAPFYRVVWPVGLTGATNSQVVITLAACAAGTGTLIVEADKW